ncbi:hypothetical protein Tco_0232380 [Tanacetum coccineum]
MAWAKGVTIWTLVRYETSRGRLLGNHFEDIEFSLLLTPLCCDDIHDFTPRVSAQAGCGRLVSEPLVIENSLIPLSRGSFDVLVGMDRLSKRKFGIVCHGKVVRIPLEGDEILWVFGERTQGVVKTLMNTKVVEFRVDLVPGATPVAKSPYRLDLWKCKNVLKQLKSCNRSDELGSTYDTIRDMIILRIDRVKLRRVRAMSMTIQLSVKDKILATSSETSKNEYEIRYHPGKANVVIDVLRREERVKPRRIRAMAMAIQYGVREMILASQSEAFKKENVLAERLHGKEWNSGDDQLRFRWMIYPVVLADAVEGLSSAFWCAPFEALHGRKCRSLVLWAEIGESSLTGPELVLDMTDKVVLIKEKLNSQEIFKTRYVDRRVNR